MIAMNFGHGVMFGTKSCYFPELFGPRVRYRGASFGFELSAAIGGGLAPIIATALLGYFGHRRRVLAFGMNTLLIG
jgi:MHS family shikimate/dehydroshikimate transporter-like MFS transporter